MLVQAGFRRLQVTRPRDGSTHQICKLSAVSAGVLQGTLGDMTPSQDDHEQEVGPDSAALLQVAAQNGSPVSERLLETFRAQGLLPRPRRTGYRGRTPIWRYPPGTDRQLTAVLRWRQQTKDPDLLTILLWLDAYDIPPAAVREALLRQLTVAVRAMDQEITRHACRLGLDPSDAGARARAIDALAQTVAAKRGNTPIPRRNRVKAGDRAHAVALMIRTFGLGENTHGTAEEADTVERVLALAPNGRRHTIDTAGPWLTGPAEDLFEAADIVALPRLLDAVQEATDADLTAASQTVVALFRYLPLMVRMLGAMFDDDNYVGLAAFGQMDQHPEILVYVVPMVIAMLKAGWDENLHAITSGLNRFPELGAQAHRILDMSSTTISANLANKPAETRDRIQRIIQAAIDGQFDTDAET